MTKTFARAAKSTSFSDMVSFMLYDQESPYSSHPFKLAAGASITVNINGLLDYKGGNRAQYDSAAKALEAWTDVTGIKFKLVNGAAQITIDNRYNDGAWAQSYHDPQGWTSRAEVNVSTDWMDGFTGYSEAGKWGMGSYGSQTFIHEIGHALGLNHPGDYDASQGSFTYANAAGNIYDTTQYSIMSYFDQADKAGGGSNLYVSTPMMADIVAIQQIYGERYGWNVNTGDTKYGKGETVLGGLSDFAKQPRAAFTISDTGGNDTFDFSNVSKASTISLVASSFSSINGFKQNVAIAFGTVIENAMGGSSHDTIFGNAVANKLYGNNGNDKIDGAAGNDFLYGGEGNDTLIGGKGNDYLDGGNGKNAFYGGAGTDRMIAGSGIDTFYFASTADAHGDKISKFRVGTDEINLDAIDARTTLKGDQDFKWIGTASFHKIAGELRFATTSSTTIVTGDNNGDGKADFTITLTEKLALKIGDFDL